MKHPHYERIVCQYPDCGKQLHFDLSTTNPRCVLAGHAQHCVSQIRKRPRLDHKDVPTFDCGKSPPRYPEERSDQVISTLNTHMINSRSVPERLIPLCKGWNEKEPGRMGQKSMVVETDQVFKEANGDMCQDNDSENIPSMSFTTDGESLCIDSNDWQAAQQACVNAEAYSKDLDASLQELFGNATSTHSDDILCQVELWLIIKKYSWSTACVKATVGWVNKHRDRLVQTAFVLKDPEILLQSANLSPIQPKIKKIQIAQGRLQRIPQGIPFNLIYRDPLIMIARQVTNILHLHGEETFRIDMHADSFEHPQDAMFLRKVWTQLTTGYREKEPILVVPFNLYADGGHMRSNGLHLITPFSMAIMHRKRYNDFTDTEVITLVPSYQDILANLRDTDPDFPDTPRDQLMPSVYHGIMHHFSQALLLVINDKLPFFVYFHGKRFRCFPVLLHKGMDMPMMSSCSFTLMGKPNAHNAPCGQCLAKGKEEDFFVTIGPTRREVDILGYCTGSGYFAQAKRLEMSLHHLGKPLFARMNPFDERGAFLHAAVDGLHSFKGLWFRKFISLALDAMYVNYKEPDGPSMDDSSWQHLLEDPQTDQTANCDYEFLDTMFNLGGASDETIPCSEILENQTSSDSGNLMNEKNPAARAMKILATERGRIINRAAADINAERMNRIGSEYLPMRSRNLTEQVSKLQEHKYSPGMLIICMALFSSDTSDYGLGRYRSLWLRLAVSIVLCYIKLFQKSPTEEILQEARLLLAECTAKSRDLAHGLNLSWPAPKIHCNLHFPEMISELGRMRYFDTTDGESSLAFLKGIYQSISNRDIWNPNISILKKTEEYVRFDMFARWTVESKTRAAQMRSVTEHGTNPSGMAIPKCTLKGALILQAEFRYASGRYKPNGPLQDVIFFVDNTWEDVIQKHDTFDCPDKSYFWMSIQHALCAYVESLCLEPSGFRISLQVYPTASIHAEGRPTIACATTERYGKRQFDAVRFVGDTGRDLPDGFGRCVLICRLTINTTTEDKIVHEEKVVFLNPLQLHASEKVTRCNGKCAEVSPILLHAKISRYTNGALVLHCLPASCIKERVTILKDRMCTWEPSRRSMAFPHGEWYFIVDPRIFTGLEQYT